MIPTRHQIAALPFDFDAFGGIEVYLVTTRGGGRWIVPKGNPIRGMAPHAAAAQEALEEAGLVGQAEPRAVGTFLFDRIRGRREEACLIDVYALKVERQLAEWAEMKQRSVLRCNLRTAVSLIDCAGLASLLKQHFHFANEAAFAS
jgi:8-oxo-dGTP pyrophosphatase MutT (NUDIX family)